MKPPLHVAEVTALLDALAPLRRAESWDNVGLLTGDPAAEVRKVLLTIDLTAEVATEAETLGCEMVVAYHPPIFGGLKRIPAGSVVARALARGIALFSPHTALDAADGGTNDVLADAAGLGPRRALVPTDGKDGLLKLVTFVPAEALEAVSAAVFEAGAGRIGNYRACSFRSPGQGTFFGEAGAAPVVGKAGRLETVDELRLETVVPVPRVADVVAALRKAHPYEEPAFDLVRLATPPDGAGQGRIGELPAPVARRDLLARIKTSLGVDHALVAGPLDGAATRIAVAAGAGGSLLGPAMDQGAQVFVTGELRHHDALAAAGRGVTVVALLHSQSERKALSALRDRLLAGAPGLTIHLATKDRDPFTFH